MSTLHDLPLRTCFCLHDTILDLHHSVSLLEAIEKLCSHCLAENMALHLRASLVDAGSVKEKRLFPSDHCAPHEPVGEWNASAYDIPLPTLDILRIRIALAPSSPLRDQSLLVILCEHLSIAAKHLPLLNIASDGTMISPREKEVLPYLLAGRTNIEIGTILGISPRTVEKHVAAILLKHSCENRIALMARGFRKNG